MKIEISDEQLSEKIYQLSKKDNTNFSRDICFPLAQTGFKHLKKDLLIDYILNEYSKSIYQANKETIVSLIKEMSVKNA